MTVFAHIDNYAWEDQAAGFYSSRKSMLFFQYEKEFSKKFNDRTSFFFAYFYRSFRSEVFFLILAFFTTFEIPFDLILLDFLW